MYETVPASNDDIHMLCVFGFVTSESLNPSGTHIGPINILVLEMHAFCVKRIKHK